MELGTGSVQSKFEKMWSNAKLVCKFQKDLINWGTKTKLGSSFHKDLILLKVERSCGVSFH